MTKSIYLIGSLRNGVIPDIGVQLRQLGFDVFDDWFAAGPEADDYWKKYSQQRGQTYAGALSSYAAQHTFEFDKKHLDRCDGAILVMPAGRSCGIEFGYNIGRGKPGWILLDDPDRWDVMMQFATGVGYELDDIESQLKVWLAS